MSDNRTPFEKFRDLASAVVRVPKSEVAAQQSATRPEKPKKTTKRAKA